MYQYTDFDKQFVRQRAAQFRDQLERNLAGKLGDEEFRPLRLQNGWYVQRHAPMLRVAVPYGEMSSKQIRQLARIAREFDRGYAHFTTRQNVQYNWIPLPKAADVMDLLAEVNMHGIQTSGNCIRNITADAMVGVAEDDVIDARPYCEVLRQWSTLHPEFAFLPRKFKIAVSGATEDRAATAWHDIGLHLVNERARALADARAESANLAQAFRESMLRTIHEIDQTLLRWAREPRPELLLILAVDSAIDADRIDHLQSVGELFTAQHQTGRVPGEGAAALLLAHPQWPHLRAQMPEAMRLWRPVCGRRDKSADVAGRIGCTTLTAVLTEVLQRSTPPHESLMVVSDADHRASRTGELFEALQGVAPELDPLQQVTRVGEACGDLGVARALVPTALACAALRASDQAQRVAVATHVQSPHERVVVALSPMPPQPAVLEAA